MNEEAQEVVIEPAEVAPAEPDATPSPDETTTSESEEAKSEPKAERTFTQAELDDILTRRLAKEQRKIEKYAKAEAENAYLREQIQRSQPQQATNPSGEPKPEQFKTYEEYLDKLTDYKVDLKMQSRAQEAEQAKRQQSQQAYESQVRENLNKVAEKYDDFEEVVSNPNLTITVPMRDAIGESDVGGEIAYYLGQNPKEAAEIAKMSNVQQVKAIDRLEAKFKAPPPVSKAPAPLETVGRGRAKTEPDLASMSVAEYAAARAKTARWGRG